jgi:glycosyltransferase involved in cell wall biosynthesis
MFKDINVKQTILTHGVCEINLIPIKGLIFFGRITYFPRLIRLITQNNYDVVQIHEDSQLMTPLILRECCKNKIKTILYQGMYTNYKGFNYVYQYFMDLLFKKTIQKNTDIFLAKTSLAKKYLEAKGYNNISVLPIGLDYKKEQKACHLYSKIKNYKSQYDKMLLYVGKIEKRRNPLFLIDILSCLDSNIALIIIGEGPLDTQMMKYARKKNVLNRLFVIKFIPNNEIHYVYKICDVFLLPTNYEIYGMVVMEALFNGIPVIATPEAGTISILTDNVLGICLPLDINKWINEICRYLNQDKTNYSSYRTQHVKDVHNWNTIGTKYYKMIINNHENSSHK